MTDLHGLYAITGGLNDAALIAAVEAALSGGARFVQYRDKSTDSAKRLAQACAIRALCRAHDTLFIVNDDVALAAASEADGVHIGRGDGPLAADLAH
jgi:thiamine-phosphate pyrophosphorylase